MTDDATLFPVRAHGHPRAPRLTRLELQGFKSFPNRTRFAFEPGITAIIGPNGSGKSNVADSVRWVLGEQGQSALRAKRTEDVIFSGGQGRAPAGMAEATLTFDNSDGWLPTEFVEVSVTRRAYRSGENQYLINGRKVRLKDVALLTSGLGQSHVVVGQGLVDAALSLRADERRGLFEHAADLAGLRLKLADAERNLAETDANTARLSDVLIELEPRLKILERAARQAREWQGLRDRLRELQGGHYRDALITALAALDDTRAKADNAALTVDAARAEVARLISAAEGATGRLAVAREQLNHYEAQRTAAEDRLRRQIHERGLTAVRFESLGKRRADMDDAREGLDERVAAVAADLTRMQSDLRDLERATTESRAAAARHNRDAEARRAARSAIELRLAATAHDLADEERQQGELLRRRAVLLERADSLSVEQERLSGAIAERRTRIATLDSDAAEAAATSAADDARGAALDTAVSDLSLTLQTSRDEAAGALAAREELHARLGEATTRLDVLRRTRESGAELHRGVREVLAAGSDGRLDGILGAVAELLVVPEDLEVAVEATLGGRLHTIIVASWEQAAAAIKHLQRTGVGRATFHPLDAMRSGPAASLPPGVCDHPGILGTARNRVSAPPEIAPVVAALLGQTLIVDELETAHAVLPQLAPDWSVATVTGEIVRADGSVTGGSEARESSSLGRERELRELPNLISELETSSATA
ncbi:MAG: AAA family ATPase [Chloroflexota bacterium]|nr:AAA family ATPase [Chloroflexota bacterium]